MSFTAEYQGFLGLIGGIIGIAVAVATYFRGVIQQNQKISTIENTTNDRIHDLELKTVKIEDVTNKRIQVAELSAVRIEETTASKLHALELDLNTIRTQFAVFWTVIEKELPKILIKPHRKDIDEMLRKMQKQGLTEREKIEMKDKMREALHEGISDVDSGLALGYALLIARIESELAVRSGQRAGTMR